MRLAAPLVLAVSAASIGGAQSQPSRVLIDTYCVSCHNQRLQTAGLALDSVDPAKAGDDAAKWERVLHKMRRGEMPPPGVPRPDSSVAASFTASLEQALDRAGATRPNPGRPAVHRLNRAEYSNAVRDLLAVDIQAGTSLPVDDSGYGFDNIADVLSMSPALLERYISAARMVSRLAVGDLATKPAEERFLPIKDPPSQVPEVTAYRRAAARPERVSPDLPFDSRGGLSFSHYFPLDAEYVIRVNLPTNAASFGEGIHGDVVHSDLRLPVKAGLHTVGVTFQREETKVENEAPGARRNNAAAGRPEQLENDPLPLEMDVRLDGARVKQMHVQRRPGGAAIKLPLMARPSAIPEEYEEHCKLMFDLQVMAYQADLTRVITFMLAHAGSNRAYPNIGISDGHHSLTHHQNMPEKIEKVAQIDAMFVRMFAYYLKKLKSTRDGDGSLLDHVAIVYGSGTGDGNAHSHHDLPTLIAGGAGGQIKGGASHTLSQGHALE